MTDQRHDLISALAILPADFLCLRRKLQRMKKNAGEATDVQEPTEGPSDAELTKEMETILDSAGDDFSMKDLLSKLRKSPVSLAFSAVSISG